MRPSRSGPALLVIAIMAILVLPGNILTDAAVPNLDTPEDTPIIGLPISLAAPGITNPVVTVTTLSTNALLLPASSVVIAGRGTDRTLSIYPGPDQYGVATVFLVAQEPDSSDAVTNRFTVTVDPVKDPPVILPVPDVLWFEGAPQPPIQVTVRYVEGIPPTLFGFLARGSFKFLYPFASNPRELDSQTSVYDIGFNKGVLPAGSATVTLGVTDRVVTNTATFNLLVKPRLLVPTTFGFIPYGSSMDLVDVNANGTPDLTMPEGQPSGGPQIIGNCGGAYFLPSGTERAPTPNAFAWDDFDGDGVPDVVSLSISEGSGSLNFWTVNPGGDPFFSVSLVSSNPVPLTTGATLLTGDFDGDGDRDVIIVSRPGGEGDNGVLLARNRGDGTFDIERIGDSVHATAAAVGDIDGDGDLDLIVAEVRAGAVPTATLWLNDGRGRFVRSPLQLPRGTFSAMGLVDLDGDGHLDLWLQERIRGVGDEVFTNRLAVLPWTPRGFEESWSVSGPGTRGGFIPVTGDFDGDGYPDLVAFGQVGGLPGWYLFENDGTAHFSPVSYLAPSQTSSQPAVGDINGDTRLDLILGRSLTPGASGSIFTNAMVIFNPPPATPGNLRARLDGTRVTFEWDGSSDLVQQGALTYNVRAGFAPGGNNLVPSLARYDGLRLVTRPGNAGFRQSLSVDLGDREFEVIYWSVQAVDAGGQGSGFADTKTVLGPHPGVTPVIAGLVDTTINEDSIANIRFTVTDAGTLPDSITIRAQAETDGLISLLVLNPSRTENHVLTVRPQPNANGSVPMVVVATDPAGNSTTNRLVLTILPVNDSPRWGLLPPIYAFANEPPPPIRLYLSDPETRIEDLVIRGIGSPGDPLPPDSLRFRIVSSNVIELTAPDIRLPLGGTEVILEATDPEGAQDTTSFTLTTLPRGLPEYAVFDAPPNTRAPILGDYDGDGRLDLAALADGRVVLWHNEGGQPWSPQLIPQKPYFAVSQLLWNDWDHDGRLDLVCLGSTHQFAEGRAVIWVLFNRPGGWEAGDYLDPIGSVASLVRLGDLDDNGELDVIAQQHTPLDQYLVWIAHRHGTRFDAPLALGPGTSDLQTIDLDRDGRTDLFAGRQANILIHETPDSEWVHTSLAWSVAGETRFLDLNRDGKWDALALNANLSTSYFGFDDALVAGSPTDSFSFPGPDLFVLRDVDGDGFPDGISKEADLRFHVLFGGNRQWNDGYMLHPDFAVDATTGDVDGDGRVDIVLATSPQDRVSLSESRIVVLRNTLAPVAPTPVAPPEGVRVTHEADGAFLEWKSNADHRPRGVTYNIRVGTGPGASDIVSPESTPEGRRLVAGPGNAGISLRHRIGGLEAGLAYYASVQAVDDAGIGGPFSPEVRIVDPGLITLAGPKIVATSPDDAEVVIPVIVINSEGALTIDAELTPALLSTGLRTSVDGTNVVIRVPFRLFVTGKARLVLHVADSAHPSARLNVDVLHGEAPVDADLGYRRTIAARAGQPTPIPILDLDPTGTWTPLTLPFAQTGVIQGVYPDLYYNVTAGLSGTDRFGFTLIAPDHTRMAVAFQVDVRDIAVLTAYLRPDARIDLLLHGSPGETGILESSTDLAVWKPAANYSIGATGTEPLRSMVDTAEGGQLFFRLRRP